LKGNTFDIKFDIKFDTILGLTERIKYNVGNSPLNAFMTLWDVGYNFNSLNASQGIIVHAVGGGAILVIVSRQVY
jgi:hypothetical protein